MLIVDGKKIRANDEFLDQFRAHFDRAAARKEALWVEGPFQYEDDAEVFDEQGYQALRIPHFANVHLIYDRDFVSRDGRYDQPDNVLSFPEA